MSRWTQLRGATALACVCFASTAGADVTSEDVWGDWKSYMEDFGYSVEGTESRSGDTLLITGVSMTASLPDDEGSVVVDLGELSFTDQDDGTVAVTLPERSTLTVDAPSDDGDAFSMKMAATGTGMSTIVSGDPDNLTYNYTVASLALELVELVAEDGAPDDLQVIVTMNNLVGAQSFANAADQREIAQTFSVRDLSYDLRLQDSEEDTDIAITGVVGGVQFTADGVTPTDVDLEDPTALFDGGFAMQGQFQQAGSEFKLNVVENGQTTTIASSSGSGVVDVSVSETGVQYSGGSTDMNVSLAGAQVPFPVAFSLDELGYEFAMPVAAAPEDQDFALGLTLGGLTVPDLLWNLFDPSEILPRHPATLSFLLDGKTRLFKDLTDPSLEDSESFPGELTALTLSDLRLLVAGAELTGFGAFTFDNTDLETFDGLPRPEGAADFRLVGGNGLLDNVIQMGLVGEEEALGTRMLMGLFARPGPGDDELTSRIEVNDQGHVSANGQRLR